MKAKCVVGIIFGGKSAEHDVSITSAASIFNHMDTGRFEPVLIYVDKSGRWIITSPRQLKDRRFPIGESSSFLPWEVRPETSGADIDIYFPVIHGTNGEDGKLQGLLEMSGKPYVGASSLSSALAMDKVVSKILFREAGILTPEFLYYTTNNLKQISRDIHESFGFPVFVKPASLGSSVGISKVKIQKQLKTALDMAFQYDRKIIIEQAIDAREIEVSAMGNDTINVSSPGELVPHNEFYDYRDKYIENKTVFHMPAKLPESMVSLVRSTAEKAFRSHFLNGMARIDFLLERRTDKLYINEMNTIPGFTEISMFAKLWELEGMTFKALISRLIQLGFDRFKSDPAQKKVFTDWESGQ